MPKWVMLGVAVGAAGWGTYAGWRSYTGKVVEVPALCSPMFVRNAWARYGQDAYLDMFEHPLPGVSTAASPGTAAAAFFGSAVFKPESAVLRLAGAAPGELPGALEVAGGQHLVWTVVAVERSPSCNEVLMEWKAPFAQLEGLTYVATGLNADGTAFFRHGNSISADMGRVANEFHRTYARAVTAGAAGALNAPAAVGSQS